MIDGDVLSDVREINQKRGRGQKKLPKGNAGELNVEPYAGELEPTNVFEWEAMTDQVQKVTRKAKKGGRGEAEISRWDVTLMKWLEWDEFRRNTMLWWHNGYWYARTEKKGRVCAVRTSTRKSFTFSCFSAWILTIYLTTCLYSSWFDCLASK